MKIARVLSVAAPVAAAFALQAAVPSYTTLIAHRGESFDVPENTLPAYRTAIERGFGFECDVYLSKDGKVFTFHDRDLTRMTSGANTNKCDDLTWDELSKLDVGSWGKWKGSKFAGTRPALLEEVLPLARDGRYIYLEIKSGPEIVPYIKDVFAKQKNANPGNLLFIAFNTAVCKKLKELMPEYKVYWLRHWRIGTGKGGKPITAEYVVSTLKKIGADGVDCKYNPDIITQEFIAKVKKAGFEFHVWTVDELSDTVEAFRRGADTVTTNCAKKQLDAYSAQH